MNSPISAATVSALVAYAAREYARGEQGAAASMIDFLRCQFRDLPAGRAAVDRAVREQSPAASSRLADILDEQARDDPRFEAEFHARWADVQAIAGDRAEVTNSVFGDVAGPVVQARDVFGGICLHDTSRPDPRRTGDSATHETISRAPQGMPPSARHEAGFRGE